MGCSLLHYDLFYNVHLSDNLACSCDAPLETAYHYFFECNNYVNQRLILRESVEHFTPFTLQTILFGNDDLKIDVNYSIFEAVHRYINESRRFP